MGRQYYVWDRLRQSEAHPREELVQWTKALGAEVEAEAARLYDERLAQLEDLSVLGELHTVVSAKRYIIRQLREALPVPSDHQPHTTASIVDRCFSKLGGPPPDLADLIELIVRRGEEERRS